MDESNIHLLALLQVLRPYGIECMFKTLKFLAYLTSYGSRSKQTASRMPPSSTVSNNSTIGVTSDPARSSLRTRTPPRIRSSARTQTPTRSGERASVDEKIEPSANRSSVKIEEELVSECDPRWQHKFPNIKNEMIESFHFIASMSLTT